MKEEIKKRIEEDKKEKYCKIKPFKKYSKKH